MDYKQIFIDRSNIVHCNKYDYSKVDYITSKKKVEIICPIHDSFWQDFSNHVKGRGCPQCGREKHDKSVSKSQEEFVAKVRLIHGDKYDTTESKYKGTAKNVYVRCVKHDHLFKIQAGNLLSGQNCPICRRENQGNTIAHSTEIFTNNAIKVHGNLYDYSNVEYSLNTVKVKIMCNKHQTHFWQLPSNHLMGAGCPTCAEYGYKKHTPGNLYILTSGEITKVGITNRKVSKRISSINNNSGLDFKEFCHFSFSDGNIPFTLERRILAYLESKYSKVEQHFDGYTECFLNVDINDLLSFVSPLLQDNKPVVTQSELEESSQPTLAQ